MLGMRIVTLEDTLQPWVDVLSTYVKRVPEPVATPEPPAHVQWGKDSKFNYDTNFRTDATTGFQVQGNSNKKRERFTYSEEGRAYTDYKVTNANDPEQYVIVRRVTTIAFNGPGSAQFELELANDTVGTEEGSGQSPPAPPELDAM